MTPFLTPGVEYDADQAACALVAALGVYEYDGTTFGPTKWVYWSANPVGNAIYALLDQLAAAGVLVRTDDGFRWADGYDPKRFSEAAGRADRSE